MTKRETQKLVGPIVRGFDEELIDGLYDAIEKDNPDADVFYEDRGGYVRIHTPWRCRVTRQSLEEALGRPFQLSEVELSLSSFSGRIQYVGHDEIVWYLDRED